MQMPAQARSKNSCFALPNGARSRLLWSPISRCTIPRSEFIDTILVPSGMNIADRRIVELVAAGRSGHYGGHSASGRRRCQRGTSTRPSRRTLHRRQRRRTARGSEHVRRTSGGRSHYGRTVELQCAGPTSICQPARSLAGQGEVNHRRIIPMSATPQGPRASRLSLFCSPWFPPAACWVFGYNPRSNDLNLLPALL